MLLLAVTGWFVLLSSLVILPFSSDARLEGIFRNPNSLATVLILCTLGVLYLVEDHQSRAGSWQWLAVAYVSLSVVVTVLSASRGGMLAFAVLIGSASLWSGTGRNRLLFVAVALVVGIVSAIWPQIYEGISSRTGTELTTLGGRTGIWSIAWDLIQRKPWTGYGGGVAPILVGTIYRSTGKPMSIHNPLLEIWIETGAVGLILYLLMIIIPVISFVWNWIVRPGNLDPTRLRHGRAVFSTYLAYSVVWVKNGGAAHDKAIFVFLAVLTFFTFNKKRWSMNTTAAMRENESPSSKRRIFR